MRRAALALALSAWPALAHAQQAPAVDRVVEALSGFEDGPSPSALEGMGPGLVPVLSEIALDPARPGYVRIRALQAAGVLATPEAHALLRRAVALPEALLVREAALALGRAFGPAALGEVAPLLGHSDTAVREGAIQAVARMRAPGARRALAARLGTEPDPVLRQRIQAALESR